MTAADRSANVARHLRAMAERRPFRKAVVCPAGRDRRGRARCVHLTYRQLDEASDRLAFGLEKIGVRRGTRAALMVRPGLEFFETTFALFKVGAVIVMIDPGMGRRGLGRCLAEAEPQAFIGIPLAQCARILFGWGKATLETIVTVGRRAGWGGWTLDEIRSDKSDPYPIAETPPNETAAILFTSGSTGPAKGAVYAHAHFNAQIDYLKNAFAIRPDEIDLATFPLFALFDAALGMTAVIPEMDAARPAGADPAKLIEAVLDHGVTQMFASPAVLDRIGRHAESKSLRLPTLKRVLSAGAPARAETLARMKAALPDEALLETPYGATEALPVASIESREILNETENETREGGGICVGRPIQGVELKMIGITDKAIGEWRDELVLPVGEVGEIAVCGPNVTREYFNRPDATRLAKIPIGDTGDVFHRMGDLGRLDEKGRLWYYGRKNHRVVSPHGVYYTIPCETIFNLHPRVRRTALVGVGPRGEQLPVVCVEMKPEAQPFEPEKIRAELMKLGARHRHTREIETFLFRKKFPVDVRHNAKIHRETLAAWAEKQLRR